MIIIIATITSLLIHAPANSLLWVGVADSLNNCHPTHEIHAGQFYRWSEIGLDKPAPGAAVCVLESWSDRLGWELHTDTIDGYQVFVPMVGF